MVMCGSPLPPPPATLFLLKDFEDSEEKSTGFETSHEMTMSIPSTFYFQAELQRLRETRKPAGRL